MRRVRIVIKLASIVAGLVVVPPAVLAVTVGNPLPGWPIDWGLTAESLVTGAIAASTWLKAIAAAAWLLWAALLAAVTADVVASWRGRGMPVRWLPVQQLVATILALSGQLGAHATALADPAAAPAVAAVQLVVRDGDDYIPAASSERLPGGWRLTTVEEGDSWAGFAGRTLDDPAAGPKVRAANVGRDVGGRVLDGSEVFVEAGWQLAIPHTQTPASAGPPETVAYDGVHDDPGSTDPAGGDDSDEDAGRVWVVEPGDHFWGIGLATLTDVLGRTPSDAEVAPYWRELIDANLDRLAPPRDPDLIYPGQQLIVPPVDHPDATPEPASNPSGQAGPADPADDGPTGVADDKPAERPAPADDRPARDPRVRIDQGIGIGNHTRDDTSGEAAHPRPSVPDEQPDPADVPAVSDPADVPAVSDDLPRTAWGTPADLAGPVAAGVVFAAGVMALVRRRRKRALQQRPRDLQLPTLAPDTVTELTAADAAAAAERPLDDLVGLLESIPVGEAPPLVVLDDQGGVRLLFDHPPPDPPPPWTVASAADGEPAGWQTHLGATGPGRSVGLPLLVTLGRLDGDETLLANLGAMRHLTVHGEADLVVRRLRAATLEVATSRIAGPVEVCVAGDHHFDKLDSIRLVDDLTGELADLDDQRDRDILIDDRTVRLLVAHHNVTVPHLEGDYAGLVGLIAAASTDTPTARWRFEITGDNDAVLWLPDGGRVEVTLTALDPDTVAAELDRLEHTQPIEPVDEPAGPTGNGHRPAGHTTDPSEPSGNGVVVALPGGPPAPAWCQVRLLGPVEVDIDGQPLDQLSSQTLELLVCLATHPDGLTTDQLIDLVWAGTDSRSGAGRVRTALAKLRAALGEGPDGQPLVPRREPGPGRIRLADHVATDLQHAQAHLAAARRLAGEGRHREQLAALALVRGQPLDGITASWAADIEQHTIVTLQQAALEAATALRQAGDYDTAQQAIDAGLKLCDPCEELYIEWARLEAARGRRHHIPQLRRRLVRRYQQHADDIMLWVDSPTPETDAALRQLMAGDTTS